MERLFHAMIEWARPGVCTGFETAVEIQKAESVRRHAEIEKSLERIDAMLADMRRRNPAAASVMEIDKAVTQSRKDDES